MVDSRPPARWTAELGILATAQITGTAIPRKSSNGITDAAERLLGGFMLRWHPSSRPHYNARMTSRDGATPKPRRRWLRFSLRTLLVVMLLLGVLFGVLGSMAQEARRQRKVVADLREMGAQFVFSGEEPSMPELLDIGYCRRVIECHFDNPQVADVTPLAELKNLRWLDLECTQVADVTPLAELKKLEGLDLSGTQVADVTPLAELKNLNVLYLVNTQVTDEQVNDLQQALPDCTIIR